MAELAEFHGPSPLKAPVVSLRRSEAESRSPFSLSVTMHFPQVALIDCYMSSQTRRRLNIRMWLDGRNKNMGLGTRKGWDNYQFPPHAGLQKRSSTSRRLLAAAVRGRRRTAYDGCGRAWGRGAARAPRRYRRVRHPCEPLSPRRVLRSCLSRQEYHPMPRIEYVLRVVTWQGFPLRLRRYQHRYSRFVDLFQQSLWVRDIGMNP